MPHPSPPTSAVIRSERTSVRNGAAPGRRLVSGTIMLTCTGLTLQGHHNFVCWDCTLAQNFPGVFLARQIDNCCWHCASCLSAVHDEWDALPDLVANARGVRTLGRTLQICRSCGNGKAECLNHCPRNR